MTPFRGIAQETRMEAWMWRLFFAEIVICAGVGVLVYVLPWIFVPIE